MISYTYVQCRTGIEIPVGALVIEPLRFSEKKKKIRSVCSQFI